MHMQYFFKHEKGGATYPFLLVIQKHKLIAHSHLYKPVSLV